MTGIDAKAKDIATKQLKIDEGFKRYPYHDSVGKLTVGFGLNLDDRGIFPEEAEVLLQNDLVYLHREFCLLIPWYVNLDSQRQAVLMNMGFNLGLMGLMNFRNMLECVRLGKFADAAKEMVNSKWYKQVGSRAQRLALIMELGHGQTDE